MRNYFHNPKIRNKVYNEEEPYDRMCDKINFLKEIQGG